MVDPAKRLDVEGVLQHPWMTSEDLGNVVLGKALEQMKKFNAKRKFKAGIVVARMAQKVTEN